jgi:voltage-gated potassium channel Kch
LQVEDPVVILGFGPQGQMLANMLASPLAQSGNKARAYIGFDLDHARVTASRRAGFNVAYGNGARPGVLKAAGVLCALRQATVVLVVSVQACFCSVCCSSEGSS